MCKSFFPKGKKRGKLEKSLNKKWPFYYNYFWPRFLFSIFSIAAIKSTFRDIARQVLAPEDQDITLTNLVADLARKAKSQEWLDFFDVLLGKDTK